MIRVAHVLPWPTIGGTEVATLRVANAGRSTNIDSIVFCPGNSTPVEALFSEAGYETARYRPAEPSIRHPRTFLRETLAMARELRKRRVELVHCSDLLAGYYAGLASQLAGVPVICHVRSRYEALGYRARAYLSPIDHFVFVSRDTWRRFGLSVPPERGSVLYDYAGEGAGDGEGAGSSSSDVREEFAVPAGAPIIGMVARIAPAKDYFTLIRAAPEILRRYPTARFLLVGDYDGAEPYRKYYAEVRTAIDAAGLTPNFIFTGFRNDVRRLVAAFDVFVLCTHVEGLPLVILEAMGLKIPVVATAVDGVPEIVIDGVTGLLHERQDERGLADAIIELLVDKRRAASLASTALEQVSRVFSFEQFAVNLRRIYDSQLGRPRSREESRAEPPVPATSVAG